MVPNLAREIIDRKLKFNRIERTQTTKTSGGDKEGIDGCGFTI